MAKPKKTPTVTAPTAHFRVGEAFDQALSSATGEPAVPDMPDLPDEQGRFAGDPVRRKRSVSDIVGRVRFGDRYVVQSPLGNDVDINPVSPTPDGVNHIASNDVMSWRGPGGGLITKEVLPLAPWQEKEMEAQRQAAVPTGAFAGIRERLAGDVANARKKPNALTRLSAALGLNFPMASTAIRAGAMPSLLNELAGRPLDPKMLQMLLRKIQEEDTFGQRKGK